MTSSDAAREALRLRDKAEAELTQVQGQAAMRDRMEKALRGIAKGPYSPGHAENAVEAMKTLAEIALAEEGESPNKRVFGVELEHKAGE